MASPVSKPVPDATKGRETPTASLRGLRDLLQLREALAEGQVAVTGLGPRGQRIAHHLNEGEGELASLLDILIRLRDRKEACVWPL